MILDLIRIMYPAKPRSKVSEPLLLGCFGLLLCGWVAHAAKPPAIAPRFHGTWVNADPRYFNWWVIEADRVVNYGVLDDGKCTGTVATIVGADKIEVAFGNSGTVQLTMVGEELVFKAPGIYARHKRSSLDSICRWTDGVYFENAPYPGAK